VIDSTELIEVGAPRADTGIPVAEQRVGEAEAAVRTAVKDLKAARRAIRYRQIRLQAARAGVPTVVLALIAGSVAAVALTAILAVVLPVGLGSILASSLAAYAACGGGVFLLFRDQAGEGDANRVAVRADALHVARYGERTASAAVQEKTEVVEWAQQHLRMLREALNSKLGRRQRETDRLLAVEPGRLYPDEFERFVAEIFQHLGFVVQVTGKGGDQGVDVIACKGSLRVAIQAKRYIGAVGNSAIQEVFAGMAHHRCHRCVVVTSASFTSGAIALARSTNCLLIGTEQMGSLIRGEITL
jgi:restriction system protein